MQAELNVADIGNPSSSLLLVLSQIIRGTLNTLGVSGLIGPTEANARVYGIVRDSFGNPLPNARLDITIVATTSMLGRATIQSSTVTDSQGIFNVNLRTGSFKVSVTSQNGQDMGIFRVSINSTTDKPQITMESSAITVVGVVAVPYSESILSYVLPPLVVAYANSPYTWNINSPVLEVPTLEGGIVSGCIVSPALPTGLSLNNNTCAISGTPTAIKSQASYTIVASNLGGSTYAYILITVNDEATKSLSYSNVPANLTSKLPIQTIAPVFTGGSPTYCTSTPALPIGLVLDRYTCSISGTTNLLVNSQNYVIRGGNITGYSETTITFGVIVEAPKSITYPNSSYKYTQLVSIPTITPVLTGGTPATCTTSPSLPAGISINSNCVIQGSSQGVSASQSYTVTATNATGSISSSVTLEFTILPPASLTYTGSFFTLSRGISISLTPSIGGGTPDTCAITPALPTGMVINQNTCTISGTPAYAVQYRSYNHSQ
jgi:hypothetical protein